ncbi:6-phosphogluconolactonase [Amnibacterium kyonggiense]|uniref:Glucosamine-6-phosphate deaminase n=1 Tax=Amnibacterium kyonggiense TaxID=595671 RepID=A0A4R7FKF0_9MICO|nr:6-phosphogluconolactonase [Amnibacterium kyonggiense]TDS76817.1 glucosamine-6-phosphate deaminase [Amnibacterium kyonggiense]
MPISLTDLRAWCAVPADELATHPDRRIPFRTVTDSAEMGRVAAAELLDAIIDAAEAGRSFRAIIPCGPMAWVAPFTELVRQRQVSLRHVEVFHMDECLDWQGHELPLEHPYSFRGTMQREFYDPIPDGLAVPLEQRHWLHPGNLEEVAARLAEAPADLAYGGWGQDGHVAYNQARRDPYSRITVEELLRSTARIQENNTDTIIALAQRTFGGAYQFVPPMSVTLGVKEIFGAGRVRLFSDTGAWKQTALRVALFAEPTPEYPLTVLQQHPDALLTATVATSTHPVAEHPEWDLGL